MSKSYLACLFLAACATSPATPDVDGHGTIPIPMGDGKQDGEVSCGQSACSPSQCSYDCTTPGALCTRACEADSLANAYVAATVSGDSFDSRQTPYVPRYQLDNVLIYGCELWDFRGSHYQGLEIEYTELIHSAFIVDRNDPTRHRRKLDVYVPHFTGPGDYTGEGAFRSSSETANHFAPTGCSVHYAATGDGTFDCTLDGVSVSGSFSCPGNAIDHPIFVAWQPS